MKRRCPHCQRFYADTLARCPHCGPAPWWRRPVRVSGSGLCIAAAGVWALYCLVDGARVLRIAPQILRDRLGAAADDPATFALAMDSFEGAFLQTRLVWWFAVTVVLLLLALVLRRPHPRR